jgi:hypothetical protein
MTDGKVKHLSLWLPIRSIAFLLVVGHALIDLATAAQIVATSFVPGLYQTMCGQ